MLTCVALFIFSDCNIFASGARIEQVTKVFHIQLEVGDGDCEIYALALTNLHH